MSSTRANSMTTRATLRKLNVDKALLDELEPLMSAPIGTYKGGETFVQGPRRIGSIGADNRAASAGLVYYEQILGIKAPTLYDYNQELELDKFVTARDGPRYRCASAVPVVSGSYQKRRGLFPVSPYDLGIKSPADHREED